MKDKDCEVRRGMIMLDSGRNHKRLGQRFEFFHPNYMIFSFV